MNPDIPANMFLFLELASLFAISLNELSIRVFNKYLQPTDKSKFDKDLKILIWGGYENYSFWNDIRSKLLNVDKNESPEDLSLPEWLSFVQLMRSCLDNPLSTAAVPLMIKEVAFQQLLLQVQEQRSIDDYDYLTRLAIKDPNATKYAILIIEYLAKASKLPKEFYNLPINMLMKSQRR